MCSHVMTRTRTCDLSRLRERLCFGNMTISPFSERLGIVTFIRLHLVEFFRLLNKLAPILIASSVCPLSPGRPDACPVCEDVTGIVRQLLKRVEERYRFKRDHPLVDVTLRAQQWLGRVRTGSRFGPFLKAILKAAVSSNRRQRRLCATGFSGDSQIFVNDPPFGRYLGGGQEDYTHPGPYSVARGTAQSFLLLTLHNPVRKAFVA